MRRIHFFSIVMLGLAVFLWQIAPPFSFPTGSVITIPEGLGLYALAEKLEEDKVIRSPFWFRSSTILFGGERDMKAGEYSMSHPQNVFLMAWRIFLGRYDIETIKLTIPEGFTVEKISLLFDERFTFFDHGSFIKMAQEGYLFPDTYFVPVTMTATTAIKLLQDNFLHQILPLMPEVELSGRTLEEIITIASLLEAEAKTKEDREMISGILWKRLKFGMPLQVDSEMITY